MSYYTIGGVGLRDVYTDREGNLYRVVALASDPTVEIVRVDTGERENHVIGCMNWRERFTKLVPEVKP